MKRFFPEQLNQVTKCHLQVHTSHLQMIELDVIKVNKSPGYEKLKTVSIKGEIFLPGKFAIKDKKERISDLVKKAGGLKETAFIEGALLIRPSLRNDDYDVAQDETMELQEERLPRLLDEEYTPEELVSIDLEKILNNPRGNNDLILLEGDVVIIPQFQGTVRLVGETLHPAVLPYDSTWRMKDYVEAAGGFTENAKPSKVHTVNYNGKANSTRKILWINKYPKVHPGSEIIIPRKIEKQKRDFREFWGVISSTLGLAYILSRL